MIQTQNIHSLTEFQRNTSLHVRRLKETGLPAVLTIKGKAALVVQTADAYQGLLDRLEFYESAMAIQRGLHDFQSGNASSLEEMDNRLRSRFFATEKDC